LGKIGRAMDGADDGRRQGRFSVVAFQILGQTLGAGQDDREDVVDPDDAPVNWPTASIFWACRRWSAIAAAR